MKKDIIKKAAALFLAGVLALQAAAVYTAAGESRSEQIQQQSEDAWPIDILQENQKTITVYDYHYAKDHSINGLNFYTSAFPEYENIYPNCTYGWPTYCINPVLYGVGNGKDYEPGYSSQYADQIGYVIKNGFPNNDWGLSALEAGYLTQAAIYAVVTNGNNLYNVEYGSYFNESSAYEKYCSIYGNGNFQRAVDLYNNAVKNAGAGDGAFVRIYAPVGHSEIQFMAVPAVPNGSLKIKKVSQSQYSLFGALYRVDDSAGKECALFITDSDGQGFVARAVTEAESKVTEGVVEYGGKYYKATSETVLELAPGDVTVYEVKPPENGKYCINHETYVRQIKPGAEVVIETEDPARMDPVGILLSKKAVEGTGDILSVEGAEYSFDFYEDCCISSFSQIDTDPTRSWVFKSDGNGQIRYQTSYRVSGDELYYYAGVPQLPEGTLVIKEVKPPLGYFVSDISYFAVLEINDEGNGSWTYYQQKEGEAESYKLGMSNIYIEKTTDLEISADELLVPSLETEALSKVTDSHCGVVSKDDIIQDNVKIYNALPEKDYTLKAKLFDAQEGSLLGEVSKGVSTPMSDRPYVDLEILMPEFEVCTAALSGRRVVVCEYLYYKGNDEPISVHDDMLDEKQSIRYPSVATSAAETTTENHIGPSQGISVIKDIVKCENLVVGQEYTVTGTLVYGNNGIDADGNEHKAGEAVDENEKPAKTFTALSENMDIEMEFNVDAEKVRGMTVVVFEELEVKGNIVCSHKDPSSKEQSIYYPDICTFLTDKNTCGKNVIAGAQTTLADKVSYRNLVPGYEYTLIGTLYDKKTGEPLKDDNGNAVTAAEVFTPEKSEGEIFVEFDVSCTETSGQCIVAFETLEYAGKQIIIHADIDDAEQSVCVPQVRTVLTNKGINNGSVENEIVLEDEIEYTCLYPGKKYIIKTTLMDKETGTPAIGEDGEEITVVTEFIPQEMNSKTTVRIALAGKCIAGSTLVAFEEITEAESGGVIAEHKDINDKSQSVNIQEMSTALVINDSLKQFIVTKDTEKITFSDDVVLENAEAETTYIIRGVLVNSRSGKYIKKDGTETDDIEEAYCSEQKAVTGREDGNSVNVKVGFEFEGLQVCRRLCHDISAFEYVYAAEENAEERLVIKEEDTQKEEQKVTCRAAGIITGDGAGMTLWLGVILCVLSAGACAAAAVYLYKKVMRK